MYLKHRPSKQSWISKKRQEEYYEVKVNLKVENYWCRYCDLNYSVVKCSIYTQGIVAKIQTFTAHHPKQYYEIIDGKLPHWIGNSVMKSLYFKIL